MTKWFLLISAGRVLTDCIPGRKGMLFFGADRGTLYKCTPAELPGFCCQYGRKGYYPFIAAGGCGVQWDRSPMGILRCFWIFFVFSIPRVPFAYGTVLSDFNPGQGGRAQIKRRLLFKRMASLPKQVLWFDTWLLLLLEKGMLSLSAASTGAATAAVCGRLRRRGWHPCRC